MTKHKVMKSKYDSPNHGKILICYHAKVVMGKNNRREMNLKIENEIVVGTIIEFIKWRGWKNRQ